MEFTSWISIQQCSTECELFVNESDTHPWRLRGHDFWVLGYGEGKFDIDNDTSKFIWWLRLWKHSAGSSLVRFGWTVLPFQADNPRAWAFHCHIEAHFYLGMGVVFAEELRGLGRCRRRSWAAWAEISELEICYFVLLLLLFYLKYHITLGLKLNQ